MYRYVGDIIVNWQDARWDELENRDALILCSSWQYLCFSTLIVTTMMPLLLLLGSLPNLPWIRRCSAA